MPSPDDRRSDPPDDPGFEVVEPPTAPAVARPRLATPVAARTPPAAAPKKPKVQVVDDKHDPKDDARPKKKARARPTDAEPGDDTDPRPKDKKKRKATRKMNPVVLWGSVASGAFVLLIVLGVGGYFAFQSLTPPPDKEIAGQGWYKTEDSEGWFTAYFPGNKPKFEQHGFQIPAMLSSNPKLKGFDAQLWSRRDGGREYAVTLMAFPGVDDPSDKFVEQFVAQMKAKAGPGVQVLADHRVVVNGRTGRLTVYRGPKRTTVSMMFGLGDRRMIDASVVGGDSFDQNDPKVAAFFENLTLNR